MNNHKVMGLFVFLALANFSLSGCGDVNKEGAASVYPHPTGWVAGSESTHPAAFHKNQDICIECHGTDLGDPAGGISKVSCSSCHQWPYGHPAGWNDPASHGSAAKAAAPGLASCKSCHGSDFIGGTSGQSCMTCHTPAPHADAPWRGTTVTHVTTDEGNAPECARCHLNDQRLTTPIAVPTGTTPGCYNSTMCHGQVGHPVGWSAASQHGTAAKAAPGASEGLASCKSCHGSDFIGGTSGQSCMTCHTPAPHADAPWRGTTVTHVTTDEGNAPECARCHLNNQRLTTPIAVPTGTTPGCFDNTVCHGQVGGTDPAHPVHLALPTSDISCTTCHSVTPGVLNFNAAYNAKSGAASFNGTANTCANVSCHGGQTTPIWATGVIAVPGNGNSDCKVCHSGSTAQYNGYVSGEHNKHVNDKSYACTACHDTTRLALTHFTTLNTPAFNNPPATIKGSLQYSGGRCATPGCHEDEPW